MFTVMLTYQRPLSEIDALMRRHVAWLKRNYESGLFIASGRRVPRVGGIILARSGDAAALELRWRRIRSSSMARHGSN